MSHTTIKIWLGRIVSGILVRARRLFSFPSTTIVERNGINWSLDLTEGIDLSIYTTGGLKTNLINQYKKSIKKNDVILEIGANIGGQTLQLAQLLGEQGKIIALEPTAYAFKKLKKNIRLNPALAPTIHAERVLIVLDDLVPSSVYASWPLGKKKKLHKEHQGLLKSVRGSTITSLDQYVRSAHLSRLNCIKIDVDGNEHDVLMSGKKVLKKFKPLLMMELAPYAYETCPEKFDEMLELLWDIGYEMEDILNNQVLSRDPQKVREYIAAKEDINILATCRIN